MLARTVRKFVVAVGAVAVLALGATAQARSVKTPPWVVNPTDPLWANGGRLHVAWEFTQNPTNPVSLTSNFTWPPTLDPRIQFQTPATYPDVVPGPDGTPIPTWHVDQDGILEITIPNDPTPRSDKYIILQITSDKAPGTPDATTPFQSGVPGDNTLIVGFPGASAWYTYVYEWHLQPNPPFEVIRIPLIQSTNIEEIVIDTICVPEPASIGVVAIGLGLLGGRRRR